MKAVSLTALATDANEILLTSVLPCVTTGSPRAPFQQSISSERHPCSSCPYELCDVAIQKCVSGASAWASSGTSATGSSARLAGLSNSLTNSTNVSESPPPTTTTTEPSVPSTASGLASARNRRDDTRDSSPVAGVDALWRRLVAARKSLSCSTTSCSSCSTLWKRSQPSSVMRSPGNVRLSSPPPPLPSLPPDAEGATSNRISASAYFWKSSQRCGRSYSRSSRLACTCAEGMWTHIRLRGRVCVREMGNMRVGGGIVHVACELRGTCVAVGALHTSIAFGCTRQSVLHAVISRRVTGPAIPPRTADETSRPSFDSRLPMPLLESLPPLPQQESPPLPPPVPPAPRSPALPDWLACACTSTGTSVAFTSPVVVA
eukprot:scaffold36903_cov66-Phaeocystis_antarctica.AAC.1